MTLTTAGVCCISQLLRLLYRPNLAEYRQLAANTFASFVPNPPNPEPMEQLQYRVLFPVGLVLLATISWTLWLALRWRRFRGHSAWLWELPAWFFGSSLLFGLIIESTRNGHGYLRGSMLVESPWLHCGLIVPVVLWLYPRGRLRLWKRVYGVLRWLIVALVGVVATFDSLQSGDQLPYEFHFNSVLYPIALLHNGVPIGGGVFSHYGLYPAYLAPLVKCLGGDLTAVYVALALLVLVSYAAIIQTVSWVFRNALVRTCIAVAVPFSGYLVYSPHADPYYQYWPIRILFPALVLCALAWTTRASNRRALGLSIAAGLAMSGTYWNVDSGLACILAVMAFALTIVLAIRVEAPKAPGAWGLTVLRQVAAPWIGGSVLATLLFFALYRIQTQVWPDPLGSIGVTSELARLGLTFLPLPDGFAFWQAFVLMAGACCLYAFRLLLCRRTELAAFHVAVGVMSLGLLVYHIGRSHFSTLVGPLWMAPVALGLIIERLDENLRAASRFAFGHVMRVCLLIPLISAPFSCAQSLPSLFENVQTKARLIRNGSSKPSVLQESADFIRLHSKPNQGILLFIKHRDGALYLLSGRKPAIALSGSTDLVFNAENLRVTNFLSANASVPVFAASGDARSYSPEVSALLSSLYEPAIVGPGISLLKRRSSQ